MDSNYCKPRLRSDRPSSYSATPESPTRASRPVAVSLPTVYRISIYVYLRPANNMKQAQPYALQTPERYNRKVKKEEEKSWNSRNIAIGM